jgi:hypothetical protein
MRAHRSKFPVIDDSGSIYRVQDEGSLAAQWTQAVVASQPNVSTIGVNYRKALLFDGAADYTAISGSTSGYEFLHDGTGCTLYVVATELSTPANAGVIGNMHGVVVGDIGFALHRVGANLRLRIGNAAAWAYDDSFANAALSNSILVYRMGGDAVDLRIGGLSVSSGAYAATPVGSIPDDSLTLGRYAATASGYHNIKFGEVIAYDRLHSDADVARFEEELGRFYGLSDKVLVSVPSSWSQSSSSQARRQALVGRRHWECDGVSGAGLVTLPPWLSIECATTVRTSQADASSVYVFASGEDARGQSRDGIDFGLLVEPHRTSLTPDDDIKSWDTYTLTNVTGVTGPHGSTGPYGHNDVSGSIEMAILTSGWGTPAVDYYTLSVWTQYLAPFTSNAQLFFQDTTAYSGPQVIVSAAESAWTWHQATGATGDTTVRAFVTARQAAGDTGQLNVWGFQVERAKYATSYMVPAYGNEREADVLKITDPTLFEGGWIDLMLDFVPLAASTELDSSAEWNLLWFDANNRVYFDVASGRVSLVLNGSTVATTGAISWARFDRCKLRVYWAADRWELSVDVAGTIDTQSGISTNTALTLHAASACYLFGTSAGTEDGVELYGVYFNDAYQAGEDFEWAWFPSGFFGTLASGSTTAALFGSGSLITPLAFDDFEALTSAWDSSYVFTLSLLAAATFDNIVTAEAVEDYEENWNAVTAIGWTATNSTNVLDYTAHPFSLNDVVRLYANGGVLPTGWSEGVSYYVVNPTADTLQLSLTLGGAAVAISTDGSGTARQISTIGHGAFSATMGSTTEADFTAGAGTAESFELADWDTAWSASMGSTTVASFYTGAFASAYEGFHHVWLRQIATVDITTDSVVAAAHGYSIGNSMTFECTGTFPAGLGGDLTYTARAVNTNDFTVNDPAGNAVVITDFPTGTFYVLASQSLYWVHELD